jgi:hypothetical protein
VKYLIFIIILLLSCCNSYAEFTNFDFDLSKYFVEDNKEVNIELIYSLDGYIEKDFLIRPVISNGIIEILNEENGKWISSYGLTTDLPSLKKNMLVRVRGVSVEKTEIFFEIRNINTGEVYLTPKKYIWSNKMYENYLERLKIQRKQEEIEQINKNEVTESSSTQNFNQINDESVKKEDLIDKLDKIPKIFFLILGIIAFIVSFIVGYKGLSEIFFKKKRIWMSGKIH